jgi:tRNA uridine 5-carboxymethylaminomethyl modification enzyme
MDALNSAKRGLERLSFTPGEVRQMGITVSNDGSRRSGLEVLALPGMTFEKLGLEDSEPFVPAPEIRRQIEKDALYVNYIDRQKKEVEALLRDEAQRIPSDFDYGSLDGLTRELSGKLERVRPETIAHAGRIEGMTPAALTLILAKLRQMERAKSA